MCYIYYCYYYYYYYEILSILNLHSSLPSTFTLIKSKNSNVKILTNRSNHPEVFLGQMLWKYASNLPENTHAEVWFIKATLLKPHILTIAFFKLFSQSLIIFYIMLNIIKLLNNWKKKTSKLFKRYKYTSTLLLSSYLTTSLWIAFSYYFFSASKK